MSELPANIRTSDGRNFRRTSGLPTCAVKQPVKLQVSGLPTSFGTSDEHIQPDSQNHRCRDSRLGSGLPTVGSSDSHRDFRCPQSPRRLSDWESELSARVVTSDCREFWLTSGLPIPTVIENYSMCSWSARVSLFWFYLLCLSTLSSSDHLNLHPS